MLLTIAAMALLIISAGAASVVLWMPGPTPLPVSEWPVAPAPLFSSPVACLSALAALALQPQRTPEPSAELAPVAAGPSHTCCEHTGSDCACSCQDGLAGRASEEKLRRVRVRCQRFCRCSNATAWRSVR
jgi:hypothetical protein